MEQVAQLRASNSHQQFSQKGLKRVNKSYCWTKLSTTRNVKILVKVREKLYRIDRFRVSSINSIAKCLARFHGGAYWHFMALQPPFPFLRQMPNPSGIEHVPYTWTHIPSLHSDCQPPMFNKNHQNSSIITLSSPCRRVGPVVSWSTTSSNISNHDICWEASRKSPREVNKHSHWT